MEINDNVKLLIRKTQLRRRYVAVVTSLCTEMHNGKEIIVRKISPNEYEVYDAASKTEEEEGTPVRRQTVIRKAPPAPQKDETPGGKRRRVEAETNTGVILIKDAIMYRIVDILMWKVMGENQLRNYGYPLAPTPQVLWRILYHNFLPKCKKTPGEQLPQDHECGGNMSCFVRHVYQFLDMCAPNLWTRTGWGRLCMEEVLRRLYYEDLIPYIRSLDLRNNLNVLQCHSDIVLLEKWERQKFTAVTWTGQKNFSQMSINCPKCPQCSNHHF